MSQSPIALRTLSANGALDALPLNQPLKLFECLYKPREQVRGRFEGEEGHGNFVIEGNSPLIGCTLCRHKPEDVSTCEQKHFR